MYVYLFFEKFPPYMCLLGTVLLLIFGKNSRLYVYSTLYDFRKIVWFVRKNFVLCKICQKIYFLNYIGSIFNKVLTKKSIKSLEMILIFFMNVLEYCNGDLNQMLTLYCYLFFTKILPCTFISSSVWLLILQKNSYLYVYYHLYYY